MAQEKDFAEVILKHLGLNLPAEISPLKESVEVGFCEKHGEYPLSIKDKNGVTRYRPAVCRKCIAIKNSGIHKHHAHCRFENYQAETNPQKAALKACQKFASTFKELAIKEGHSLIMIGSQGTGKNHLSIAIMHEIMESGFTAYIVTARDLILKIREGWKRDSGENESQIVSRFAQFDLLVIDEIGKQYGGKGESIHLFDVINKRYMEDKPTILISNETLESVEEIIGKEAFDRICEKGTLLKMNWGSHRRKKIIEG